MAIRMTPTQVVDCVRQSPWFLLGGFAVFVMGLYTENYVSMTGLLSVMLGACLRGIGSGMFIRGMWLVTTLFWFPTIIIFAALSYLHIWHLLKFPTDIACFVSLAIASWLLGIQSRFLLTVTTMNWKVFKAADKDKGSSK